MGIGLGVGGIVGLVEGRVVGTAPVAGRIAGSGRRSSMVVAIALGCSGTRLWGCWDRSGVGILVAGWAVGRGFIMWGRWTLRVRRGGFGCACLGLYIVLIR